MGRAVRMYELKVSSKGRLRLRKDLSSHLKQSMFADEREWPVLCRYSSEPGDPGSDVEFSSSAC
ncbi:hypothetical protein GJ744_009446 [Endocarpon pusillum]|uniref:Uncharacterized protein n=1 Tax=Endocarpon pusillum TaxID=364733 RepID=A0A8H7E677_9EURO|nr:hypothetical protein GJ744_009446 [Endocarpon pusillum]